MRLDKLLSEMNIGTRSEVKEFIRKGKITVNGVIVKKADTSVSESDEITYLGKKINYSEFEYYILNKPAGVISATEDPKEKTVIDLLPENRRKDLFPVGRLDKDTEGLLLITNDGKLSHNLLSPKRHVEKKYYAKVNGNLDKDAIQIFKSGMVVPSEDGDPEFIAKPASLEIINDNNSESDSSNTLLEVYVTITEGRYHQVKRMIRAVGGEVTYLKRLSMGDLTLDESLQSGEWIKINKDDLPF